MKRIETNLTDFIAGLAPWLAPVPTAWLVGAASMRWLGWPWPVAIVAAVIVESLGLGATATALTLWDYNRSRRKVDPGAPVWVAAGLVGVYFVIAVLLTVALDIVPTWAAYAPGLFPVLSLTGVTVLALRSDHRRRLAAIAAERAERKAERQARRQVSSVKRQSVNRKVDGRQSVQVSNELLTLYTGEPMATPTQAARALGVSRQTIYNQLEALEGAGRIRRNGHGVEVIE